MIRLAAVLLACAPLSNPAPQDALARALMTLEGGVKSLRRR
jgi:hypothetical protein